MATSAQIEANQANARRSTGPRSAAGKARSAANSTRHGFCSQSVLLPGDDPAEYQAMLDELTEHFSCGDLTETRFIREMADAEWRLRRVRRFQEVMLTEACEEIAAAGPSLDSDQVQVRAYDQLLSKSNTLAVMMRYETKFERQYERAHKAWCNYQTEKQRLPVRMLTRPMTTSLPSEPYPAEAISGFVPDEPNFTPNTPRNAPCPCGSGAKYKRCCGRDAAPVLG